ncbi:MAG TPA: glycosyltransferase [Steroidobacteraceae bacterium]|nr:glycosyltransferase [Steroidobacteraceae bacterium]
MSLRVLFVSDVYFPRVNGVSTSIRTFRGDLAREGVQTMLVAPEYPGASPDAEPGILRIASGGVPLDPEDRRFHSAALERALNHELAARIDLVHIHTPFIAHYAAVRFARRHGLPVVATYHTFFEDYLHHYVPALPRRVGRFLARHFTRSQCDDVAALISPSAPMRDALLAYGVNTPIEVVPTGLPAESYTRGIGARFRERFGLPADRPLLLYVGRVAHEKNIDFLLRMFARLRQQRPDAQFVIAGEGPAREHLVRLARDLAIAEHVRFIGYLDRATELPDCYAAGDAFVFASRTETQGLVLLEAMAQGTAVVSTAELGTRSILTPGCGAFVVAEDEGEFAAAAARALALGPEDPRRRQLRAHAESWASRAMARRLVGFYEKVLAQAPQGRARPQKERGPMGTPFGVSGT